MGGERSTLRARELADDWERLLAVLRTDVEAGLRQLEVGQSRPFDDDAVNSELAEGDLANIWVEIATVDINTADQFIEVPKPDYDLG